MSKELKIENHFYGSIGQHIDHVDSMTVTFDKDMNMHIEQLDELHAQKKVDILPNKPTVAKNATVPQAGLFCRITQHAIDDNKAQDVDNDLRKACVSAPKLVRALRINEALDYLDTQNLKSKELYELLDEHYGLRFKPHTFTVYRGKR